MPEWLDLPRIVGSDGVDFLPGLRSLAIVHDGWKISVGEKRGWVNGEVWSESSGVFFKPIAERLIALQAKQLCGSRLISSRFVECSFQIMPGYLR